jgi:hypothetical protein
MREASVARSLRGLVRGEGRKERMVRTYISADGLDTAAERTVRAWKLTQSPMRSEVRSFMLRSETVWVSVREVKGIVIGRTDLECCEVTRVLIVVVAVDSRNWRACL